MKAEHTIRIAGPDDLKIFKQIRMEALRSEPSAFASRAEDWQSLSEEEWMRRLVANPVFIATEDEWPVGIMGLMTQKSSRMAHRASIIMVYVRKDHRGMGLAGTLLRTLTQHARILGIRQLELMVNADNPAAIGFYNREGYAEIGRIPGGLVHEGREFDQIMMARRIDQ